MDKGAHQSAKFQTFGRSRQVSQKVYFDRLLLLKVYRIWAKKEKRGYFWWYWRLMQSLMESWLVLFKMMWGIWQIFTRVLKSFKIGTLIDPFIQSRKCMTLKLTGKLCFMTMKNDAKFEVQNLIKGI